VASRGVAAQLAAHGVGDSSSYHRHRPQRLVVGKVQSYGLCHSSACSSVLIWQRCSPSGLFVLHLELELNV